MSTKMLREQLNEILQSDGMDSSLSDASANRIIGTLVPVFGWDAVEDAVADIIAAGASSIASKLRGVSYLSDYRPLEDPVICRQMPHE